MQHGNGGLREGPREVESQSAIKLPILLFPVKDMQTLRQSQREAAISALECSAHWSEQLQESITIHAAPRLQTLTVPFGLDSQAKPAHTGP